MPIDILVNAKSRRVYPDGDFQSFDILKHSQVEVADWLYYIEPVKIK